MAEASVSRARGALISNIPNRGFEVSEDKTEATLGKAKLAFEDDRVRIFVNDEEVGTTNYGKTQMTDLIRVLKENGVEVGKSSAGRAKGGKGGPQTEEQKAKAKAARQKAAETRKLNKAMDEAGVDNPHDLFRKVLTDNGWEPVTEEEVTFSKDDLTVELSEDSWELSGPEGKLAEGTYAAKAYAVVEAALEERGSAAEAE